VNENDVSGDTNLRSPYVITSERSQKTSAVVIVNVLYRTLGFPVTQVGGPSSPALPEKYQP
jgi:hypothetical protein